MTPVVGAVVAGTGCACAAPAPGSIFISGWVGLPAMSWWSQDVLNVEQDAVRVPQHEERNRQQHADDHVAPERREPQPQPVHNDVSARQPYKSITSRQVNVPAVQRLERDDGRVDPPDDREQPAPEVEEIDVGHGGGSTKS